MHEAYVWGLGSRVSGLGYCDTVCDSARLIFVERSLRQEIEGILQADQPLLRGVLQAEGADRRALELLAVRIAEVSHQLADVRARRALDLELPPLALVPQQLVAVHRDRSRVRLHELAPASLRVEPLAAHLHGGVR